MQPMLIQENLQILNVASTSAAQKIRYLLEVRAPKAFFTGNVVCAWEGNTNNFRAHVRSRHQTRKNKGI
jgi:hypothetical protein